MSKVYCVVLNFNKPEDTVVCIQSLHTSRLPRNTKILVVDNGPKYLKRYFTRRFPKTLYVRSPHNKGFAAGNNLGITYALQDGASHVLIINPDVTVPRNFLQSLIATCDSHTKADIVAPALTEGNGIYSFGGRINWHTATFPIDSADALLKRPWRYEHVTFACVLIQKEVFKKVGLFDERYFMYLEDVDYCVAAARAGFGIYLDPSVVVVHKTSSSFRNPLRKIIYSYMSVRQFIKKWYRFPNSIIPSLHANYFYLKEYLTWSLRLGKRAILKER